jgi:putative flavoprotein involved in K+ transport
VRDRHETIVIGAGQAGLSVSNHLSRRGLEHVVLERGDVGDSWRTKRWDGFYLNTPKFTQQLPGYEYDGPEPDAFSSLAETIDYLDGYAASFSAPVRTGVEVLGLRSTNGELELDAEGDVLRARNVIVATGAYPAPAPTPLAELVPSDVFQLHADDYRRPDQLPDGATLVVGGGQSGCQIADELIGAGRAVYLSVGRCPWAPRRYRGREIVHWLIETGFVEQTVDSLPSPAARLMCNVPISGNDGVQSAIRGGWKRAERRCSEG